MSRNEDIDNAIWDDLEELSADAMLLYLWSFTNPRCNMAGLYKVSVAKMDECKVPLERIPAALEELARNRLLFHEDGILWVRARVKRLRARSPQMLKAVLRDFGKVRPDHPLAVKFVAEYGSDRWVGDELKRTYRDGMGDGIGKVSEKPVDTGNPHTVSERSRNVPGTWDRDGDVGTGQGKDEGSGEKDALPADFPGELLPHLRAVFKVLRDLSVRHNAKAVGVRSLALVVMGRPHKPLVKAAHDFAAWADGSGQRRRDVVSGYRNWLDRENDLAGFEDLDANGRPAARVVPIGAPREPGRFNKAAGL